MVDICQKTVQKTGTGIIRVTGLVRFGMMNVMGNDINFFRDQIDGQVSGDKPPELIPERICAMRTIPVIPDRAMGAPDYHAVKKSNPKQVKVKIIKQKNKQAGNQQKYPEPVKEGQPVLFCPENVQSKREFF